MPRRVVLAVALVSLVLVLPALSWNLLAPGDGSVAVSQAVAAEGSGSVESTGTNAPASNNPHRSPQEVAITPDGRYLVTANCLGHSVSLIDVKSGKILQELPCGERPTSVVFCPDGVTVLVSTSFGGTMHRYTLQDGRLVETGSLSLPGEPRGIAVAPDGKLAYVAVSALAQIAVIDVAQWEVVDRINVEAWPRHLAITPDGSRMAVATNSNRRMSVIDLATRKELFNESFGGINAGQMQVSADGSKVYFGWMVYRHNPVTVRNVKLGWVLGSRLGYMRMDEQALRFAITTDEPGLAVADPYGVAVSPDGTWIVMAAGGSQELLVYRLQGLPFQDVGGPGDHIDPALARDRNRYFRVPLGGRPQGVAFSPDSRYVYVANYINDSVQEVDLKTRKVSREFHLGGPSEPSLARKGEALFYDARLSLDQWYSCHTCHYEGGVNAVTMDTRNDGTDYTFKTVLSLVNVTRTPPWTWHGWQQDLNESIHNSITKSMLGKERSPEDIEAIRAFLDTLQLPPNPYRNPDGSLTEAALRGKAIFEGSKAGCSNCHNGQWFTDGKIHDVGQGSDRDYYKGYNTPSLLGVYRRVALLHHGKAKSLEEVLTEYHKPSEVAGEGDLTPEELSDLIAYLKSL